MNDPDTGFDALLAARFEQEHTHVPADAFVTTTLREVRKLQRRATALRIGLRMTALLVVVLASPWLIAGTARLNAALGSSIIWTAGLPGAWMIAALVLVTVLIRRARSR